MKIIFTLTL